MVKRICRDVFTKKERALRRRQCCSEEFQVLDVIFAMVGVG